MADDLLKGFRMGMDLGAPLVQAAMRKRELKMQAERDTIQNLRQSRERSLDRAAQQELEDIRQTGMDRRSDAQLKMQGDQLAESSRHNKEMESISEDANDLRRMEAKLRRREMRRKRKQDDDNNRPETEKIRDALLTQRREVADWTKKRDSAARLMNHYEHGNTDMMSSEEYETAKARFEEASHQLAAIEDTRNIYASQVNVAMKSGDTRAVRDVLQSIYTQSPARPSNTLYQGTSDAFGAPVTPTGVVDLNTGRFTPVAVPRITPPDLGSGQPAAPGGLNGFGGPPPVTPVSPGGLNPAPGTPNPEAPGGLGGTFDAFFD